MSNDMKYAGFWLRVAAYLIDALILFIPLVIFSFGIEALLGQDNPMSILIEFLADIALWWAYYAILESSSLQGTLGKKVLGLKVVNYQGGRISFGRATGRFFAQFLSSIILFVGYIMVAFTQKKQGLHDIMAQCLVVRA